MQTIFRLVVMLLSLAILWKGWQLYGPPTDQLKSIASRAIEMAERALEGDASSDGAKLNPDDPRTAASQPEVATVPPAIVPALPLAAVPESPALLPTGSPESAASRERASISPAAEPAGAAAQAPLTESLISSATGESGETDERNKSQLDAALARLAQMGIHDHRLESWGTSGRLYRFSCRAAWGEAASFSRHFESVASEPLAAVEAVAEKVDAWRAAEH